MHLEDKIIVVTGGAGLLGREFCKMIVNNGGVAIIAELNTDLGNQIKGEIGSDKVFVEKLDITNSESVNKLIEILYSKFGRIDALVNSAYPRNKNYGKHFFDVEYSDFCENLGMNLGGYFLSSQQFAKFFEKQGHGNIINMSSIYGVIAPRFEIYEGTTMTTPPEYSAIKGGLLHLTKYMAKYFKGKNIRVNAISLGGLQDKQPEIFLQAYKKKCLNKGMLSPNDISGTLLYLLSDFSHYVNGQNIVVDGGFVL